MSTEKHYAGDWAKAKSRDLVKGMIERTLLTFRKPKDISVLCFPGIDGAEVIQVYDALGIPRENVVGLERDPEIAEQIRANCPGIEVVNQSLEDYVTGLDRHDFSVISLDYTGGVTNEQLETSRLLKYGARSDHLVFHSANLIKRDRRSYGLYAQHEIMHAGQNEEYNPDGENPLNLIGCSDEQVGKLTAANERLNELNRLTGEGGSLASLKREGYAGLVLNPLQGPTKGLDALFLRWVAGEEYQKVISDFQGVVNRNSSVDCKVDPENPFASVAHLPLFEGMLFESMKNFFSSRLAEGGINLTSGSLDAFFNAARLGVEPRKSFAIRAAKPYSYVSESGSPMAGVVALGSFPRNAYGHAQEMVRFLGYPSQCKLADRNRFLNEFIRYGKDWLKVLSQEDCQAVEKAIREPIFLGSSAKPVLTKTKAIEEFRSGATVDEVRSKFRGVNGKPLAAWKAHVTMGTYDPKEPVLEEIVNGDIETITKEDAIDLLGAGIPPKEIHEAYPTSFTAGQLRAFKAHITMGSYSEEKV